MSKEELETRIQKILWDLCIDDLKTRLQIRDKIMDTLISWFQEGNVIEEVEQS